MRCTTPLCHSFLHLKNEPLLVSPHLPPCTITAASQCFPAAQFFPCSVCFGTTPCFFSHNQVARQRPLPRIVITNQLSIALNANRDQHKAATHQSGGHVTLSQPAQVPRPRLPRPAAPAKTFAAAAAHLPTAGGGPPPTCPPQAVACICVHRGAVQTPSDNQRPWLIPLPQQQSTAALPRARRSNPAAQPMKATMAAHQGLAGAQVQPASMMHSACM